jgi:hypothetical protein
VARGAARSSATRDGKRGAAATVRPVRKQRSPRFFATFGLVGIVFSLFLIILTINKYHDDQNKYPAAVASYAVAQTHYPTAVATYHAALAQHIKPTPTAPKPPVAPQKPELSFSSFSLPVLYLVLSVAYFYLGYRVNRQRQATGGT